MSWKYTDEYYRDYTGSTWNESAEIYTKLMERMAPFSQELLSRVKVGEGMKILDIGTGPGEPALTLAKAVGNLGHITGIDLSEKMIELAKETMKSENVENTSF